jgi:hypothetical protein
MSMKTDSGSLRVLHVPGNIGGNPYSLSLAEREVGLTSRCVELTAHPFGYGSDSVMSQSQLGAEFARPRLLSMALRRADVVHFNFGRTIFPDPQTYEPRSGPIGSAISRMYGALASVLRFRDVDLLRRQGKVIAVTFQGDDIRQWSSGGYSSEMFEAYGRDLVAFDGKKRQLVQDWSRRADLMFAVNPDLLRFLPNRARFLPYANVDPERIEFSRPTRRSGELRVAHAPTSRAGKGSHHVVAAVTSLRAEGLSMELDLIEGVPHSEAMRRYREADVVVDQLLVGFYGGLAVETMAMGKPTVAFIDREDIARTPTDFASDLPVVNATTQSLRDVLREMLFWDRNKMTSVAIASREFVERFHDPVKIASGLKDQYLSEFHSKQTAG